MIRLMGFLVGTVSVAAGLWVLSNTTQGERVASNVEQAVTHAWTRLAAEVPAEIQAFPSRVEVTESGSRTWRLSEAPAGNRIVSTTIAAVEDDSSSEPSAENSASSLEAVTDVERSARWHTFWHAFQRRSSAQGFADRLAAVTGLEFRVIDRQDGSHAVAFAYQKDEERTAHLIQIRARTGLTVSAE